MCNSSESARPVRQSISEDARAPCLVLDANIWYERRFLLLNTPLGAALTFAIGQRRGVIGMPEVLRKEILKHSTAVGLDAVGQLERARSTLSALGIDPLMGVRMPVESREDLRKALSGIRSWPVAHIDKEQVEASVSSRLSDLEKLLHSVPMTLEHAKSALDRVIRGDPPNGPKNQQFKDSLIWEAVLDLGEKYNVSFVTADRGFFEKRSPDLGPARELVRDVESRAVTIQVYHVDEMQRVLTQIQEGVPQVDSKNIMELIKPHAMKKIAEETKRRDYAVGDSLEENVTLFVTKDPDVLAATFRFSIAIDETRRPYNQLIGSYTLDGMLIYNVRTRTLDDVEFTSESTRWDPPGGALVSRDSARPPLVELGSRID